jgi:hypothetical protein
MRYDEFRDRLQNALRDTGLHFQYAGPAAETMELANGSRRWERYVRRATLQDPEPFHISAKVAFEWSPVDAARAYTCEEDLLTDLLGRKQRYPKTQQRWTRVDLALRGTLPYGSTTPMPDLQLFSPWSSAVGEKLDRLLPESEERGGRIVAITGGREEVTVEAHSSPDGMLCLRGVAASGFRLVRIPRVWDDPARQRTEKHSDEELAQLAARFRDAIDEWSKSVADLARWIRYSPPPPGTKPAEPWVKDENEDPETIH